MNVLFLEDRGAVSMPVNQWLEENGHEVLDAFNPADAQDHWNKREQHPVHCILLDLRLPWDGLTEDQKTRAEGGTLAGWVWFHENVLPDSPEMRQRTIIHSDFVSVLRDKVPAKDYEGIRLVPKRQRTSVAERVAVAIREIENMNYIPPVP